MQLVYSFLEKIKKMKTIISIVVLSFVIACAPTKIACVGDSITYGAGIKGRDSLAYPQQLQQMLGKKYEVKNYGVSGATLLKKGNKPYWKQSEYQATLNYNPKIIVLLLGTNDSKPINWDKTTFSSDYNSMLRHFLKLKSKPKIYIGLPPPVIKERWGIRKDIVEHKIIPILKTIAKNNNLNTIDFYTTLNGMDTLFSDGIHPNANGAKRLASLVKSKILETQ